MAIKGNSKESSILDLKSLPSMMQGRLEPAVFDAIPDYPVDPIDITGGSDGYNFAYGDLRGKTVVAEFIFVTEFDDYLLCKFHTEKVYVAKPPMLRISKYNGLTYDGKTFTRQAVNQMLVEDAVGAEDDETWLITPDYVAGDVITAINHQDTIEIAGPETYWQEIESNRVWAVQP